MMPDPIRRLLVYEDHRHQPRTIGESEIPALTEPVVILGDPGLGKSVLTERLGALAQMKRFPAGTFMRTARPETLIDEGDRIIVDGLDEIVSAYTGGGVHAVLEKLSQMGSPPFILSCRAADWRGAADRIQIADDYQADPLVLHLQPFDRDDAEAFLRNEFPALDPDEILAHVASRGLDGIYQNPLTLRLLGEVAQQQGPLPDSRAGLLERACTVMLTEENPRHQAGSHAQRSDEDLLLASGAICATLLLCDRTGVFTGDYRRTLDGAVHLSEVAALPHGEFVGDALRTRLFQGEAESIFSHIHRVVAEFLGARWLARCAADGRSDRRIFGLFRPGDGVPTSLRGLHAWIAHFSAPLATRCIAADPYAVLRYGDTETIGLEQARALLAELKRLSEKDPYFASEDWGRHPASGLMRPELREDILAILNAPDRNLHLFLVVTNAMVGTSLARDIAPEVCAIVLDPGRSHDERSCAADVLRASEVVKDWDAFLHRLLELADSDSARLACELLTEIGAGTVALDTGVDVVLSHLGIPSSDDPGADDLRVWEISGQLFSDIEIVPLMALLDTIASRMEPLVGTAPHSGVEELGDLVRRLMVRVLESDAAITPERLWTWIRWHDGHGGYDEHVRRRLAELLGHGKALRIKLLEHILLTPCAENTWMAAHRLNDIGLDLFPTHDDVASLLRIASSRAGDGSIDVETCRDLFTLGATHEGPAEPLRRAAVEVARHDPVVRDALASRSEVAVPDWMVAQQERQARAEAERQQNFERHRAFLAARLSNVAAGNVSVLRASADAYLGRWGPRLNRDAAPHVRLNEFLGDPLANHVLEGFIAVLDRDDLPSAADIVMVRVEQKYYPAEVPMFCGVAELIRQGRPLDVVNRNTLAAVYAAWQRWPGAGDEGRVDIGPALERVLFPDERSEEDHFRTSIEPQLAAGLERVDELHRLIGDDRLASLAGRLCVDWLRRFPGLPASVQTMLVSCTVDKVLDELRRQVDFGERIDRARDPNTRLLWLSAAFVAEFEQHRDALHAAAADQPSFIWFIRDRFGRQFEEEFSRFSIPQLVFVVEAFGVRWEKVAAHPGYIRGSEHPWDASRFVGQAISEIASRPTPEATAALQRLIDGPAESYGDAAKHALAQQRKARRDAEYAAPSTQELKSVMDDRVPESIDGMRAYLLDRLESLQERMQASNTDMWETYWVGPASRCENFCRNRLVDQLSTLVPRAIQIEPEAHMPEGRRADFVLSHDAIRLPIEIKGQWHDNVWNAASEQLDAYYAREWRAQDRGVYIVLWFGNVPGKQLPGHPDGLARPATPQELREMLIARLPESRRSQIDVFVMDLTPPVPS